MPWTCDSKSAVDGICWVLALVVIAVLVYLGCCELRRPRGGLDAPPPTSARRARNVTGGEVVAARAATNAKVEDAAQHAPAASHKAAAAGSDVRDAFQEFDVDSGLARIAPEQAPSNVPDELFLQEFLEDDNAAAAFRPINKEQALLSANTRPAQHMQNGRDNGPKSRTVGVYEMAFAGRGAIERPVSSDGPACIPFNDTDTRQLMTNQTTPLCDADGSCQWPVA